MAKTFAGATRMATASGLNMSIWDGSGASQGRPGSNSPRVGAMFFPGLGAVNWRDQEVSRIVLAMDFAMIGGGWAKTLNLYEGTKYAVPSGTGADMLGAWIGAAATPGPAFGNFQEIAFDRTSNPEAFARLKEWLLGGVYTLAMYTDETTPTGDSYSRNYLKSTGASVTVYSEPKGSGGRIEPESVKAGGYVSLTIEPMPSAGTLTHTAQFRLNGAESEVFEVNANSVLMYMIPYNWIAQLPDSESGAAECILTTYENGVEKSSRSIPFTVTVPASAVPAFRMSIEPDGTTGGYYQKIGGALIAVNNAQPGFGATIKSCRITGSEDFADEGIGSIDFGTVTPVFRQAGRHSYTATVTDSRGRSTSKKLTADVAAVSDPVIDRFEAERYAAIVNDAGETEYVSDPSGEHVHVTLRARIDPAGGNNTPTAEIVSGSMTAVIPWTEGGVFETVNDRGILPEAFTLNEPHEFVLTVSDRHTTVAARARVEKGEATLVVDPYGVSFGGYSTATGTDPKDEFHRPAVFYGGTDGLIRYGDGVVPTGKRWLDGRMVYAIAVPLDAPALGIMTRYDTDVPADAVHEIVGISGTAYSGSWTRPLPYLNMNGLSSGIHLEAVADDGVLQLAVWPGSGASMTSGYGIVEFTMAEEYETIWLRALYTELGEQLIDNDGTILTV